MLEVKVNVVITMPELAGAINNLAAAISGKMMQTQSAPVVQPQSDVSMPIHAAPAPMPVPANPAPMSAPANPAPIPSEPTQVTPTQPQMPAVPVQQPVTPIAGVPLASAPQFTVDQIMTAGAALMDAGKVDDLLNLLHSFGVQAVMDLKPEQLGAFATEMRKLGAAI